MSRYDVKSIANSSLPIGGLSNKNNKNSTDSASETKINEPIQSDEIDHPSSTSSATTLSFALPIKQDPSTDYWSNILGFHNNPSSAVTTTPFNMDFSAHAPSNTNSDNPHNAAFFSGSGIFFQQQNMNGSSGSNSSSSSSASTSSIPFATPIFSLNSNSSSYENGTSYGNGNNWIGHTFQTHAKPSLFQTPIFGMEWAHAYQVLMELEKWESVHIIIMNDDDDESVEGRKDSVVVMVLLVLACKAIESEGNKD
jgi:AP2-like factor, ANT lineage